MRSSEMGKSSTKLSLLISAMAASASAHTSTAFADDSTAPTNESATSRTVRNDNPRTSSSGFDPEALERGAKALREISASSNAKKVSLCFPIFICNYVSVDFFLFFFQII